MSDQPVSNGRSWHIPWRNVKRRHVCRPCLFANAVQDAICWSTDSPYWYNRHCGVSWKHKEAGAWVFARYATLCELKSPWKVKLKYINIYIHRRCKEIYGIKDPSSCLKIEKRNTELIYQTLYIYQRIAVKHNGSIWSNEKQLKGDWLTQCYITD